jgi:hypothetical protein
MKLMSVSYLCHLMYCIDHYRQKSHPCKLRCLLDSKYFIELCAYHGNVQNTVSVENVAMFLISLYSRFDNFPWILNHHEYFVIHYTAYSRIWFSVKLKPSWKVTIQETVKIYTRGIKDIYSISETVVDNNSDDDNLDCICNLNEFLNLINLMILLVMCWFTFCVYYLSYFVTCVEPTIAITFKNQEENMIYRLYMLNRQ